MPILRKPPFGIAIAFQTGVGKIFNFFFIIFCMFLDNFNIYVDIVNEWKR